ncbi:MAG: transglycosylase domain-containing protein [Lactovum sp.]
MNNGNFKRSQTSSNEKKKRRSLTSFIPKPVKRVWRRYNLTSILLLVITVFLISVTGYLYFLSKVANVEVLEQSLYQQTQIYDNENQLVDSLAGRKGTTLTYEEIPQNVKDAVIATEDRTFYTNGGVNYKRTIFALLTAGKFGGGSTITQQLAKNSYLTQEQTIDRKAREIFLALQITKKYEKNDILTMYLNSNEYGNGVIGLQDASLKYFGVDVKDLSLDEAATLVGMLKGPSIYNPLYSLENATARRDTVLQNMVAADFISQNEADNAMQVDMSSRLKDSYVSSSLSYKYPSYYNAVLSEAQNEYGLTIEEVQNNGYRIYTGLNSSMQEGMQEAYSETSLFPIAEDGVMAQSGSVALDPQTGEVLAIVGNSPIIDYSAYTDFNYALQSQRSPGSVIKPLIVYAPAIEEGWAIDQILKDEETDYDGWKPQNADQIFHGEIPLYDALANSYNIPAINIYKKIGPSTANKLGEKFSLTLDSENNVLPTALGAGVETNPLEIAQAYSVFANEGIMYEAHFITEIRDASGKRIEKAKVDKTRVISKETASTMTQMMLGTFSNGTGIWAAPKGYEMAGKTGTNEDIDQWVVAYTPDIVIAEWLGFEDATIESHRLDGTSAGLASAIFRQEASYILPYTDGSSFEEENIYESNNIAAVEAAWTYQRQAQDDILTYQQQIAGSTGNIDSEEVKDNNSVFQFIEEKWNEFTGLFK